MKIFEIDGLNDLFSSLIKPNSRHLKCRYFALILVIVLAVFVGLVSFFSLYKKNPTVSEIQNLDSMAIKARNLSRLDPDSTLRISLQLLEASEKLNYEKGLGDSYRLLSITSARSRNYELAQEYLIKAQSIFQGLNHQSGLADVEISFGSLANSMDDTLAAINHFKKALFIFSKLDQKDRMRIASFNTAHSFADIGRVDSAEVYFDLAFKLRVASEDLPSLGEFLSLHGKIEYLKQNYEKAEDYFLKALEYDKSVGGNENFQVLFESNLFLSKIYKSRGMIDRSTELLQGVLSSDRIYEDESYARQTFMELIDNYQSLQDYQNAYSTFSAKENFESELERRKVELAKNFSAELSLYRGFQLENEFLSSKLSERNKFILIGGVFTLIIVFFVLRLLVLNLRNRRLTTLVEKSHELAEIATLEFFFTPDWQVRLINTTPTGLKILEIPEGQKDFGTIPLSQLLGPTEIKKVEDLLGQYLDSNRFLSERMTITDLAGNRKVLGLIGQIFSHQGGVLAKGIMIDKTHEVVAMEKVLENLEKEKSLTELRSQMMHMTSHEFRTPLSTVSNAIELISLQIPKLSDSLLQEKLTRTVVSARDNITKLVGMLDELLLHEHVQSEEFVVKKESIELLAFAENLSREILGQKSNSAKINFLFPSHPLRLRTDPKLLYHILSNLLTNAVKYLDKDLPIEMEIIDEQSKVSVRVKDYGIGVPEEDLAKLFTPFKRASNVGNRKGTGLGLSIVKRMVDRLGGEIHVESQVGNYTMFMVVLPKDNEQTLT